MESKYLRIVISDISRSVYPKKALNIDVLKKNASRSINSAFAFSWFSVIFDSSAKKAKKKA
jgi:hypothetical protein